MGCKQDMEMGKKSRTPCGGQSTAEISSLSLEAPWRSPGPQGVKWQYLHPVGREAMFAELTWKSYSEDGLFPFDFVIKISPISTHKLKACMCLTKVSLKIIAGSLCACKWAFCFPPELWSSQHAGTESRISRERIGRGFLAWCNWMWIVNYITKLKAQKAESLQLSWISYSTKRN